MKFASLKPKAFTLIELLIVVAIIAILAAIAVPNFLEAQVRAKVTRAKADIRSIVTALESYHIDNRKYIEGEGFTDVSGNATGGSGTCNMYALTTPIAYMSSLPATMPFGSWVTLWWGANLQSNGYLYWGGDWFKQHQVWGYGVGIYHEAWLGSGFSLTSIGPSKLYSSTPTDPLIKPYDPTNGTRSSGDLYYPQGSRVFTSFQ